jgi:hypothetical protein
MWSRLQILGWIVGLWLIAPGSLRGQSRPDVMVMHSYDSTRIEVQRLDEGIRNALVDEQRYPVSFQVQSHYLGFNTVFTTPIQRRLAVQSWLFYIRRQDPEILVLADPAAVALLGPYIRKYTDIRVVAAGSGRPQPEEQARLREVTHVDIEWPLAPNGQLWETLLQKPDEPPKGMIIVDGFSEEAVRAQIGSLQADSAQQTMQWEVKTVGSWQEFQAAIRWANYREDIDLVYPLVSMLPWSGDVVLHYSQMVGWITRNANKPVIGSNLHDVELGLPGGIVINRRLMGERTGRVAAQLLRGESQNASTTASAVQTMSFNRAAFGKLGLTIPPALLTAAEFVYDTE